jgi:transglutaminase-like putative cysteine protease
MSIHVALNHVTTYSYDRRVGLSPQVVRLRPAPHCRTPILSYSLRVEPGGHFINWQQDPFSNYLARLVFPDKTTELKITVDLVAEMSVYNPFDFFLEPSAEQFPFTYDASLHHDLLPYLATEPGVEVRMSDGFEGLKATLPPPTRRGVVLMDPSYELDRDYSAVVTALRDGLLRFAEGTFMVWYPLVSKLPAVQLPKRLKALASKRWVHARLTVQALDARGFGMAGSGVFIINPPHTLHADLDNLLPWLHEALKQFDGGGWVLEQKAG